MKFTHTTITSILFLSPTCFAIRGKRTSIQKYERDIRVRRLDDENLDLGGSMKNAIDNLSSSIDSQGGIKQVIVDSIDSFSGDADYKYYYDYRYNAYLDAITAYESGISQSQDGDEGEIGISEDSKDKKAPKNGGDGESIVSEDSKDYADLSIEGVAYDSPELISSVDIIPECEPGGYVWSKDDEEEAVAEAAIYTPADDPVMSPSIAAHQEEISSTHNGKHNNKRGRRRDLEASDFDGASSYVHRNSSLARSHRRTKREKNAKTANEARSVKVGREKKRAKTFKAGKENKEAKLCKRAKIRDDNEVSQSEDIDGELRVIRDYMPAYATTGERYGSSSQHSSSSRLTAGASVGIGLVLSISLALLRNMS